ncbi:MAG: hypothetical protein LBB52_08295 [Desulfovibrio sp.]|jgi:hypothetical protein|nr:hypothetical protein [Desulfovibrio sp.]
MENRPKPRCAGHVTWIVEPHGVVLINSTQGLRRELAYPEAAVWDLATRGRSEETIRSMLELIAGIGPRQARELVGSCLDQWAEEGWLKTGAPE